MRLKPLVKLGVLAMCSFASLAQAQTVDVLRGQRLYELACIRCHTEAVHDRKQPAAKSFEEIRGYVRHWSGYLGLPWTANEIEDVTWYLNQRFYDYTPVMLPDRPLRSAR